LKFLLKETNRLSSRLKLTFSEKKRIRGNFFNSTKRNKTTRTSPMKTKSAIFEKVRNQCYFFLVVLLVLNVFDAGFTGYSVLAYGVGVEQNPFMYLLISNFGLVGFQLVKCLGITFIFFFAWFLIENLQSKKHILLAYIVLWGLLHVDCYRRNNEFTVDKILKVEGTRTVSPSSSTQPQHNNKRDDDTTAYSAPTKPHTSCC